jgi:kynureninase
MFDEIGMDVILQKRDKITSYLEFILQEIDKEVDSSFEIITPLNPLERGSQLSVLLHGEGRSLFDYLMKNGVITDWREPNVIRLAPVPLYTSYTDMYEFGQILKAGILNKA